MTGARPREVRGEEASARWVRRMFGRVARRYDLLNHLLSLNIDRRWREHTVRRVRPLLGSRPRVLDVCCGTADLTLALEAGLGVGVAGSDFCRPMLAVAKRKIRSKSARSVLLEADTLRLPVADASLDLLTVAFGFRNLANYEAGLAEMRRVLAPEGVLALLEFSQPSNRAFGAVYGLYSRWVLPWIGGVISGSREAYAYLPDSVRKFPTASQLAGMMRAAGFREVSYDLLTGGIAALHVGRGRSILSSKNEP